jgi:Tol biopolymer transport system component
VGKSQLTWSDLQGEPAGAVGEPGEYSTGVNSLAISPDGTRAVISRVDREQRNLWILEFSRGTMTRLTFDGAPQAAVWSPDGRELIFRSARDRKAGLYRKPADGSKDEELLLASDKPANPTNWSPDGRFLLYDLRRQDTMDLWVLSLEDRKARPLIETPFDEGQGVFSPDGRWIAYLSNESGREEVYVRAFLADGTVQGKWLVSRGAMHWSPHWRADSREMDYVSAESNLMAVAIGPGVPLQAGAPKAYGKVARAMFGTLSPDGKRVLTPVALPQGPPPPFTVVLHWQNGLGLKRP